MKNFAIKLLLQMKIIRKKSLKEIMKKEKKNPNVTLITSLSS